MHVVSVARFAGPTSSSTLGMTGMRSSACWFGCSACSPASTTEITPLFIVSPSVSRAAQLVSPGASNNQDDDREDQEDQQDDPDELRCRVPGPQNAAVFGGETDTLANGGVLRKIL